MTHLLFISISLLLFRWRHIKCRPSTARVVQFIQKHSNLGKSLIQSIKVKEVCHVPWHLRQVASKSHFIVMIILSDSKMVATQSEDVKGPSDTSVTIITNIHILVIILKSVPAGNQTLWEQKRIQYVFFFCRRMPKEEVSLKAKCFFWHFCGR